MRVYLGSHDGAIVHYWAGKYPDCVGQCFSPPQFKPRAWIPYFLDNGAYKYFANNKPFDEVAFFTHLRAAKLATKKPVFIVIPDSVGSHSLTSEMWDYFYPKCLEISADFKYAFVAQDGCKPSSVPKEADWVFIGGTDTFKKPFIKSFASAFLGRCHVGRVNNIDFVFRCHDLGVTSVDGTGWFRSNHGKPIYSRLEQYFDHYYGQSLFTQKSLFAC